MFIHLQDEIIVYELPAELVKKPAFTPPELPAGLVTPAPIDPATGAVVTTPDPVVVVVQAPYVLTDEVMVAAGWYRFTIEPEPAVLPGEKLTYTRTTNGGDCVQSWSLVPKTDAELAMIRAQARQVTKLAFRNRFTIAEKVSLDMASLDDPSAPIAQRQQAAMLRVYLADMAVSEFIDLNYADTRAGVQMLEGAGLLAAGRASQILDAA